MHVSNVALSQCQSSSGVAATGTYLSEPSVRTHQCWGCVLRLRPDHGGRRQHLGHLRRSITMGHRQVEMSLGLGVSLYMALGIEKVACGLTLAEGCCDGFTKCSANDTHFTSTEFDRGDPRDMTHVVSNTATLFKVIYGSSLPIVLTTCDVSHDCYW